MFIYTWLHCLFFLKKYSNFPRISAPVFQRRVTSPSVLVESGVHWNGNPLEREQNRKKQYFHSANAKKKPQIFYWALLWVPQVWPVERGQNEANVMEANDKVWTKQSQRSEWLPGRHHKLQIRTFITSDSKRLMLSPSDSRLKMSVEQRREVSVSQSISWSANPPHPHPNTVLHSTYCACTPGAGWGWWSSPVSCDRRRRRSAGPSGWACCRSAWFLSHKERVAVTLRWLCVFAGVRSQLNDVHLWEGYLKVRRRKGFHKGRIINVHFVVLFELGGRPVLGFSGFIRWLSDCWLWKC